MLDFKTLAQKYGIQFADGDHHHCRDGWIQTHCPFCAGGHDGFHLGFNLEYGYFHCWRCGNHSVRSVIHNLLPWSLPWKIIKEFQRDGVAEYHQKAPTKRKTAIAPSMMNTGLPPAHRKYLRERRFSPGILLNLWDLHHTGMSADRRWSWRIIAPIFDMACDVMAYTGRSIQSGDVIRWQTSKNEECACDTKELLYGIHVVPDDTVFIVEGVTDVWRLGAGAVATMGIDWNQEQVNILRLFRNRFILFDDHPVAQTQANKLAEALGPFPGNTVVVEDYGADDPGSLDQTAATELMRTLKRSVVGPQ